MVKETEFYEVLHVEVDAEEHEIKRSYRRLALKYHPDKNPGDNEAAEMFKRISHAYETLSDSDKRSVYDKYGKDGLEGGAGAGGGGHGFADASDIFSAFFGGGSRQRGEPKPRDLVHELELPLEDFYTGTTKKVSVARTRLCSDCSGEGVRPGATRQTCPVCRGHGVEVRVGQVFPGFYQQQQVECSKCGGEGQCTQAADVCRGCSGKRTRREKIMLSVVVERGAAKNDMVRFTGDGDQVPGVRLAGDVLIFLAQRPHPHFRRVGLHLLMDYRLTLQEALCGFELPVEQLDGRMLLLKPSPGQVVSADAAWCIYREGMPQPNTGGTQRGNLYVHFNVEWPNSLPTHQIESIAECFGQPSKLPLMGGQQVKLMPRPTRPGVRREAEEMHVNRFTFLRPQDRGTASTTRAAGGNDDEDEYEDVTDDDSEDDDDEGYAQAQWRQRQQQQHGFHQGFPGGAQTVQCAQQ